MKKILSLLLVLVMCVSVFAACAKEDATEPSVTEANGLDNARSFLIAKYKDLRGTSVTADFALVSKVIIGDKSYSVSWVSNNDKVAVGEPDAEGNVNITIKGESERIDFKLTGTITDENGQTTTIEIERYIPAVQKLEVTDDKVILVLGGKYVTGEEYLYVNADKGTQKYELVMSDDKDKALKLTIRNNDDNTVTFVTDENKFLYADGTNVQLVAEEGDNTKFVLESAEGGQFIKCAKAEYNGYAQYLEVYGGYVTCYSKKDGADLTVYTFTFEKVSSITAQQIMDAAYALVDGQDLEGGPFTLTGEITKIDTAWSDSYGNITVTIKVEGDSQERTIQCYRLKGDGAKDLAVGDKITVTGNIKNYSGTVEFDSGCTLVTEGGTNEGNTNGGTNEGNTNGGTNEGNTNGGNNTTATYVVENNPVVDTAYKFAHNQVTKGSVYYFTGVAEGNFLSTSTNAAQAVDVKLETAEGGYYITFMDGTAKKYINVVERTDSAGKVKVEIADAPTSVWVMNDELHILTTTVISKTWYLGTYDYTKNGSTTSYTTISASDVSYITGDNAEKVGVSQFLTQFYKEQA